MLRKLYRSVGFRPVRCRGIFGFQTFDDRGMKREVGSDHLRFYLPSQVEESRSDRALLVLHAKRIRHAHQQLPLDLHFRDALLKFGEHPVERNIAKARFRLRVENIGLFSLRYSLQNPS